MAEDKKEETPKEQMEKFKKQVNKKDGKTQQQVIQQVATRDKLERDYKEDNLYVTEFQRQTHVLWSEHLAG